MTMTVRALFIDETGEEVFVPLSDTYTLEDAAEDHPEWRYTLTEVDGKIIYNNEDWE
jgi:hypothetical protein